jgi:hypothetical protein
MAWLGAGANGCYSVNADKSASFELFNALRAGFSGEVRAGGDFEARATVFLQRA